MNNVPRLLLVGAHGRMGRAVAAAAAKEPGLTIKVELGRGDPIAPGIDGCDVVIDFSSANATEAVCRACAEHRKALVLGTTGHNATQKTSIAAAARQIPIVFAANFSVGVNALFALTRRAAELLGTEFDVDVIEMHHRTKKDAPSGTAKRLVEILTDVGEANRPVATQSIRAGDIVGESDGAAFLYRNGVMVDLNSLLPPDTPHVGLATGINDHGQIVGLVWTSPCGHAALLTPVPGTSPQ
jgi:4-hydroxy-tetrahydrodipicolinate reductase